MATNDGVPPHGHGGGDGGGEDKQKRASHKRGNSLSEGMSRLFFGIRHVGGGLHAGGGGSSGESSASHQPSSPPTTTHSKASSQSKAKKAKRGRSQSSKDRTSRDKITGTAATTKKRSGGSNGPAWDRNGRDEVEQPAALPPPSHRQVRAALAPSAAPREPAVWRSSSGGDLAERWSVRRAERDDHHHHHHHHPNGGHQPTTTTTAVVGTGLHLPIHHAAPSNTATNGTVTPPALSPRERKEFIGRARTSATPPHSGHKDQRRQRHTESDDGAGSRSRRATPVHSPLGPSEDEHPWSATSGSEAEERRGDKERENPEPEQTTLGSTTSSSTTTTSTSSAAHSTEMERVQLTKRTVQDFEFGKVLGEGSYGQVRAARDIATGLVVAVKILDKRHVMKENKVEQVKREKQILESLSHPNIIHLYGTFQDATSLFFVTEYCPNGELQQHLKRLGSFNLECTQFYIAELVSALEYLHLQGIVHRDIKPENLLLDAGFHLKLVDFGTAKSVGLEQFARSTSFVGTAEYVPPELLNEHYSVKSSDLWALSCVLYQFLAGKSPFRGANDYKTFRKIKKLKIRFPTGFPAVAKDLVQKLLVPDWTQRLDYAHLKSHRFFDGINWATLHTTTPPPLAAPAVPIFVDEEREKKLKAQQAKSSVWGKFLFKNSDEVIIQTDRVAKISKHFFGATKSPKKRQLILTDFPRLFYVDIDRMAQAGEIEWRSDLRAEARGDNIFEIFSGEKTYIFEFEAEGRAAKWCAAIGRLQRRNNGEEDEDEDEEGEQDHDDYEDEQAMMSDGGPLEPPAAVGVDPTLTAREEK